MDLSVNEFKALTAKAALGAGLPPGLAVEAARASAWLGRRGLDGAGALVDALNSDPGLRQRPATDPGCRFPRALASLDGPSVFDLLVAGDAQAVQLERLDSPLLVLGYAGVAAATYGVAFDLRGTAANVIVTAAGVARGAAIAELCRDGVLTVNVSVSSAVAAAVLTCVERIAVSDDALCTLERHAHATLVPATTESRARGAGGADSAND